jgi:hypothetical protein
VGDLIAEVVNCLAESADDVVETEDAVRRRVLELTAGFPIYE